MSQSVTILINKIIHNIPLVLFRGNTEHRYKLCPLVDSLQILSFWSSLSILQSAERYTPNLTKMAEVFEEQIYEEIEETENSIKEKIYSNVICKENEETEITGVAENTQIQSNNEEKAITLSEMKETAASVLLKSEIQHFIKDKVSNQNKICGLGREAALTNQIKEKNEKRIEYLDNIQAEAQRKLYEKTYRQTEIEMYITNTCTMLNVLKEYQDQIDARQQKLLENKNKLHHAYTEKNSQLIKTMELLNIQKFRHKEKMKTLISERDVKYKKISEELEETKERIKFLQGCDNQLNEISQLQENLNENNLRNNTQKEQIDAKTCVLKMKQNDLKSLRENINHLEESKKNMILVHEENLNLLNENINIARVK